MIPEGEQMKSRRMLFAALLALFSLVAAACGSDAETATDAGDAAGSSDSDDGEAMEESSLEELNVAYFAEWPTPNQIGQEDGSFAEAVGVDTINWIPFASGGEMSEAMIAGDIDISYSQGLTPFAGAINNGADLKLVGIAVSYSDADNCIVNSDLGVTWDNASDTLAGATVMTPFGNVTHYKMLEMMSFLDVDLDGLNIVQAESGATTAAAFEVGDIDVGCAFGGSIENMIANNGEPIFTGAQQQEDVGIFTYDIVSIPTQFGEDHRSVVVDFLRATEEFNDMWRAAPDDFNDTIATAAGMEDVGNFLAGEGWFVFPTIEEQLGADWLDGNVGAAMQGQVETLAELGGGAPANGDFAGSVDASFLEELVG